METISVPKAGSRRKIHPDQTPREVKAGNGGMDPEEFLAFLGRIKQLKEDAKNAQALVGAAWKAFINKGGVKQDAIEVMRWLEEAPDVTAERIARQKLYAEWLNLPIGKQMNIFEIPQHIIPTPEEMREKAYKLGKIAGLTAADPDMQAWHGTEYFQDHLRGWHDGQAEILAKLKPLDAMLSEEREAQEQRRQARLNPQPPSEPKPHPSEVQDEREPAEA